MTLGVYLEVGVNQIQFLMICIYSVFDDLCMLLEIVSNLYFNLINYLSFIVVEVKVLYIYYRSNLEFMVDYRIAVGSITYRHYY